LRKSGMPLSVLMPAPVKTTARRERAINSARALLMPYFGKTGAAAKASGSAAAATVTAIAAALQPQRRIARRLAAAQAWRATVRPVNLGALHGYRRDRGDWNGDEGAQPAGSRAAWLRRSGLLGLGGAAGCAGGSLRPRADPQPRRSTGSAPRWAGWSACSSPGCRTIRCAGWC